MKRKISALLCLALSACVTTNRPVPHAPPEEAASFEFPRFQLPEEGLEHLEGPAAAAVLLAMDDFLPRDAAPPRDTSTEEACRHRLESYEVSTAPASEGVLLVRFVLDRDRCPQRISSLTEPTTGVPLIQVTTYAVDVRRMRVLTFGKLTRPLRMEEMGPRPE